MTADDSGGARVHVRVALPGTGVATTLPSLLVAVEDVSRADAPAVRLGERVLPDVDVPAEGTVVEVDVRVATGPDPRRRFVVRARAGTDAGARAFAPGDLVSTTSVPVLLDGADDVDVTLRPV